MITGKETSFWEAFAAYPPYYVRILAKDPGNGARSARSDAEIAIASAIPINRVREISRMLTWDQVTYGEILAFTSACGFDPSNYDDRGREVCYRKVCIKRQSMPFQYLRKHPKWHSEFLPLVKLVMERFKGAQNGSAPV